MKQPPIAIIGAGSVGSTTAYAIMLKNITSEIMLVDINTTRCHGEVLDLSDTISFCGASEIKKGTAKDAGQAKIIIIAAGVSQKPGQTRIDLLKKNKNIITAVIDQIKPINKDSIIIVVTNPVDILTLHIQSIAGLPRNQVFGTGTFLDSQRLRGILQNKIKIAEQSIHAYILGEHGDTQFPAWSCAQIGGIPIINFPGLTPGDLQQAQQESKDRAYDIISCKGATYYGIAACVAAICENIIFDQKRVLPLSHYQQQFNICLSTPVVLGEKGIERTLTIQLDREEQKKLNHSAEILKKLADQFL